jgi:PBSX family phage terminase large subunit
MRKINPNLKHLHKAEIAGFRGAILKGSSRSGKTFSSIHNIIRLCSKSETPLTINIVKETYNSFKTTLYDDFNRILPDFGLYSPFLDKKEVDSFKILGSKINLLGADKPSKFHGASCDYLYLNEMLDVSNDVFDQAEMRCRGFWWGDFNPKLTQHWVMDKVMNRPDVSSLITTWKDNPYVSKAERNKILSYEPTKYNIDAGTADDYMWKVYGLGIGAPPEGLIFKNVKYIDNWPINVAHVYGLDFGFTTDPSALVRVGEDESNIYLELLMYQPTEKPSIINDYMTSIGIEKNIPITADSSDKYTGENKGTIEMVRDLRDVFGWQISKVSKTKSIMHWLGKMKEKRVNIIVNNLVHHAKGEQENYRLKMVNGIAINQPIDNFNHFWDGSRYGYISLNGPQFGLI